MIDNGVGFNVPISLHTFARQQHFGLANFVERIEGVDGTLSVRSAVGEGTQIVVQVPITTDLAKI